MGRSSARHRILGIAFIGTVAATAFAQTAPNVDSSGTAEPNAAQALDDGGGSEPFAGQCLTNGSCNNFTDNYPTGTYSTNSESFTTVATDIYGGEYAYYSVTSGNTYEWTLCAADGANAPYDSQLTLWNQNGTTRYCYSDDFCGDDANISWTATFTGTVRVLVSQYYCLDNSTETTLRWRRASGALPDLQAPEAQWQAGSVNEGAAFWATERIYNGGSAAAGTSYAKLYLSTDNDFDVADDYYVGEKPVGALNSGASEWVQWDFTMPNIGSGQYSVWAVCVVDARNQITEADENNIWKTNSSFTASDPPLPPDIRVVPTSLQFTCASTTADAAAEGAETVLGTPPPSAIDGVEKPVNPDVVVAAGLIAAEERVPAFGSPVPTESGVAVGSADVWETQDLDEGNAGIVSPSRTAHRLAEFARLKAAARSTGSAPVIVELAVPNIVALTSLSSAASTPAGLVQADGALGAAITTAAQAELARLAAVPHSPGWIFPYVPFMSLRASERALEILEASPTVLDINEDRLLEPTLDNTVNIVEASAAWARGFDGSDWYVAIIDTGILASHNFFAGKSIVEACFALGQDGAGGAGDCPNGLSSDTRPPPAHPAQPYPSNFCAYEHGTHVAGIASGDDPNRVPPLYGVARGANVIAVKVFSKFTTSPPCGPAPCTNCLQSWTSDVIAGLNHVYSLRLAYNMAAVNMSLGGGGPFNNQASCDNANSATKAIIDSLRTAGIATVIASGNDGFCNGIGAPACISSAIAVGALNDADAEPFFNNYGALLDLFAPGIEILSSVASTDSAYASESGTSMAAPHVTGAWAILKQACPSATVTEAFSALQSTGASVFNACTGVGFYPQRRIRINTAIDALCNLGPTATTWESVLTHTRPGQAPVDVPLDIPNDGLFSEPRSGVKKIVVTFLGPLDPTTAIPANVTICGIDSAFSPVDLSGVVVTTATTAGDTKLEISFAPALPDYARYRIALKPAIHGANGEAIQAGPGGLSRIMTALQGDATGDRRVNATDVGGIRSLVPRDPINPAILNEVRGDANNDKRINATDVGGARSLSGNDARAITDPVCP